MRTLSYVLMGVGALVLLGAGCASTTSTNTNATTTNATTANTDVANTNVEVVNTETTTTTSDTTTVTDDPTTVDTTTTETEDADTTSTDTVADDAPTTQTFDITAKQFAFDPATITVHKGDTVILNITSVDVPHGFSLPDFGVSETLTPNQTKTVQFVADQAGTFTYSCSVVCGSGHSGMSGQLVVE